MVRWVPPRPPLRPALRPAPLGSVPPGPVGGQNATAPVSVVVPTLNEAESLPDLLRDLALQGAAVLEVIVADGGSSDGTTGVLRQLAPGLPFPLGVVTAPPGRGRQMNRGAAAARGGDLLFLHADTRLPRRGLLAEAARAVDRERLRLGTHRVAGHFGLRFRRTRPGAAFAYYLIEAKSFLNRPGTVNGDQGLWIARRYFEELGGFDETLPYLEDLRLTRRVFETGTWVTLPGWVHTSARRFEAEGVLSRLVLNAVIRTAEELGLREFLGAAPGLYRVQADAGPLRIGPFLRVLHRYAARHGWKRLARLWFRAGDYAARNLWQIPFVADCLRNFRRGVPPGRGPTPWLERYDRYLAPASRGIVTRAVLACAVAAGFYGLLLAERMRNPGFPVDTPPPKG